MSGLRKIFSFLKREIVLTIAWMLAIFSSFLVHPSKEYIGYIDWRTLGILWSLMVVIQGFKINGVFDMMTLRLLSKTKWMWQIYAVLIALCFFSAMVITNDVALITFVPFAIMILKRCNNEKALIKVIVLMTIAANLGSMLTPIGNPQNLYLYGGMNEKLIDFILVMLPYTLLAFFALIFCICFLNNKNDRIEEVKIKEDNVCNFRKIVCYVILFILALLTVVHVIPCFVLVVIVLVIALLTEKEIILKADYVLLFTFAGFFIFTGNMVRISYINFVLNNIVGGHELVSGIIASQVISNVPATLLLTNFSSNLKQLLIGVNIGGLGTIIASMASLISYKLFSNEYSDKRKYLFEFSKFNILFLIFYIIVFTISSLI
ncbi:MAG: SLC13 family permease [Agathobacter sp.]|nr:SLC13 family permease [Agathobacter sp.]